METQGKNNMIVRSVLTGLGMAIVFLLIGTVLDYIVTQALSQFVIADCSEDCYFRYFNITFVIVTLLSFAGGIHSGIRTYKRLSEKRA